MVRFSTHGLYTVKCVCGKKHVAGEKRLACVKHVVGEKLVVRKTCWARNTYCTCKTRCRRHHSKIVLAGLQVLLSSANAAELSWACGLVFHHVF